MHFNRSYLYYLIPLLIGIALLSIIVIIYIQHEKIESELNQTDKAYVKNIIQHEVDEKISLISMIGTNVKSFYDNSEFVTHDEYNSFMKGIFAHIPEIKNIFILKGNTITESYPYKDFINSDFHSTFPTIPVKIDNQTVGTVAFPINQELTMVMAIPFEYLSVEKILPKKDLKLIIYAQNKTLIISEIEINDGQIITQDVEFTEEELANSVYIVKETNLYGFKTKKPINLEYIVWYESFKHTSFYFEVLLISAEISIAVLIPLLLFRSQRFNNYLKQKTRELNKARDELQTSNDILTKTQKLLLKSEERFRNLYNLSPYPIFVIDKDGKIQSYNIAFQYLFQYSHNELIGKPFSVIVSEKGQELSQKYFTELQEKGELNDKESWLKKKDGTEFPVIFSSSGIMDSSGKTDSYMNVIVDQSESYRIRELKQKYNELLQDKLNTLQNVERHKDEFASMVSHELKTPLFPIKFHAKMLQDQSFGELTDEQKKSLDEIYQNAEQLERLISDLLDVQRIEMNTMKFTMSEIHLNDFMKQVFDQNKIYMKDKNISFVNNTKNNHTFNSDPNRLKQVFSNLITNSIDFVPDNDGKIEIGASKENNSMLFYVKDNGIGIPEEKQHNLFKKFYQIDTSATRKHGGTGLGLPICKGIVEGLKGNIWFESKPQKGTTFFFSVPSAK